MITAPARFAKGARVMVKDMSGPVTGIDGNHIRGRTGRIVRDAVAPTSIGGSDLSWVYSVEVEYSSGSSYIYTVAEDWLSLAED